MSCWQELCHWGIWHRDKFSKITGNWIWFLSSWEMWWLLHVTTWEASQTHRTYVALNVAPFILPSLHVSVCTRNVFSSRFDCHHMKLSLEYYYLLFVLPWTCVGLLMGYWIHYQRIYTLHLICTNHEMWMVANVHLPVVRGAQCTPENSKFGIKNDLFISDGCKFSLNPLLVLFN